MKAALALLGVMAFPILVAILLSPAGIAGCLKDRREGALRRQAAMTEAIEQEFGPIVSPEVTHPLWGRWQIRIAVPFARPAAAGRVLSVAGRIPSLAERLIPGRYEIVLVAGQAPPPPTEGMPPVAPGGSHPQASATAVSARVGLAARWGTELPA